jgi:hypothetical protein
MTVSLKQSVKRGVRASVGRLSANRRNAAKSTGPQSAEGKRIASLNAMRHGLTSRASIESNHPSVRELSDLISAEIGDHTAGQQIACKIIEFERTLHAQHQVALAQSRDENGYRNEEHANRLTAEMRSATDIFNMGERNRKNKDLRTFEREEMEVFAEAGKLFQSIVVRQAKDMDREAVEQALALRRYFKRASNQLIKAILRLAEPGDLSI